METSQLQMVTIDGMPRDEAAGSHTDSDSKDVKMKDSKALLLDYLASVRDPDRAASLFADDGVFELPFLRSLGVEPRYRGRREIAALVHKLLEIYPDFAFAPRDTRILIETPEKTFAEYEAHARAAATGRTAHHLFTGYLRSEEHTSELQSLRHLVCRLLLVKKKKTPHQHAPGRAPPIPPPSLFCHVSSPTLTVFCLFFF